MAEAMAPLIMIAGSPRSGTTWLGQIFNSHPRVLYRHEPDMRLPHDGLPYLCPPEEVASFRTAAADYLWRLAALRSLGVAGKWLPIRKARQSRAAFLCRSLLIAALRAAGKAVPRVVEAVAIPDMVPDPGDHATVIKSVVALGRARLLLEAEPRLRMVYIVRHPCGHVASVLRGRRLGKLEDNAWLGGLETLPLARLLGLTAEALDAMPPLEQLTWRWTLTNDKAVTELAGHPRVVAVTYESLCREPQRLGRRIIEFAGLPWCAETQRFIERSANHHGDDDFFSVNRVSAEAARRWRVELSAEQVAAVLAIARHSAAWGLFEGRAACAAS